MRAKHLRFHYLWSAHDRPRAVNAVSQSQSASQPKQKQSMRKAGQPGGTHSKKCVEPLVVTTMSVYRASVYKLQNPPVSTWKEKLKQPS